MLFLVFQVFCSTDIANENNSVDDNIPTAEEATEATEVSAGTEDITDIGQTGVYTEHVFTDPLGVQNTEASPVYQPGYVIGVITLGNVFDKKHFQKHMGTAVLVVSLAKEVYVSNFGTRCYMLCVHEVVISVQCLLSCEFT